MLYNDKIQTYFMKAQQLPLLNKFDPQVLSSRCGDKQRLEMMELQVRLAQDKTIDQISYRCYGSGVAIAAMAWLAEWLMGKSVIQAEKIQAQDIIEALDIPEHRFASIFLLEDTLKTALENYLSVEVCDE